MSHNLNENGKRMMYVGEVPWHGLGTKLENPATAKEAIEAANLDYKVEQQPIYLKSGLEVPEKKAVVRVDTEAVFGVVSPKYQIVQNVEAFNFFDVLVGEGQAIYHTAGALGEGERIWILAKLPGDILVAKDDLVQKYLILTNAHDGKSSLKVYFSPVRVVCQNTLTASLGNKGDCVNIMHLGNINDKIEEARRVLGLSINVYAQFEKIAEQLATTSLKKKEVETYYNNLLFKQDEEDQDKTILLNQRNELLGLFENGRGNSSKAIRHTAWTAYNAVTEYVDHYKTIRGYDEKPTNRLKNIWFGRGAELKRKAYDQILELVKTK